MTPSCLVEQAYALGLAPPDTTGTPQGYTYENDAGLTVFWDPDTNLAQADAVFRTLRTTGWATTNAFYTALGYGECRARLYTTKGNALVETYGPTFQKEALALLTVSVRAMAMAAKGNITEELIS